MISSTVSLWLHLLQSHTHSPLAAVASLIPPTCEAHSDLRAFALPVVLLEPICPHAFAWLTSLRHSGLCSYDIQRDIPPISPLKCYLAPLKLHFSSFGLNIGCCVTYLYVYFFLLPHNNGSFKKADPSFCSVHCCFPNAWCCTWYMVGCQLTVVEGRKGGKEIRNHKQDTSSQAWPSVPNSKHWIKFLTK